MRVSEPMLFGRLSDYVIDTQAAIELLRKFNGGTTNAGDMVVYRAIDRLTRELRRYLTGK